MAREHDRYMTGLWVAQEARKREGWTTDCAKTAPADAAPSGRARADAAGVPSKYGNVKTGKYASKKEATRALALALMQEAGQILNLREQVPYVLIPRQLGPDGKVEERAVGYVADFVFDEWTADGWRQVTEDCKGFRTPDYIIKRKLMRFTFGIVVRET